MPAELGSRLHEAAHQAVAVGMGWKSKGVTVVPGAYSNGCARSLPPPAPPGDWARFDAGRPFLAWPEGVQRLVEGRVVSILAGDLAAEVLSPADARLPDQASERLAERIAELPEVTEQEREKFTGLVNDPEAQSDEDQLAKLVWAAHGYDLASAAAWLTFMERQVRQLIGTHAAGIYRLAHVLESQPTLTGEQVEAILREDSAPDAE